MNNLRKTIFQIIEHNDDSNIISKIYDLFMMIIIFISIVPLAFRDERIIFQHFETISAIVFITDYILRLCTADFKICKQQKWKSFLIYPFTPIAIIDILSILPCIGILENTFKIFRVTRLIKTFRLFKIVRYSHRIELLFRVFKKERLTLLTVFMIAIFYIIITALIMFNTDWTQGHNENGINNFFDALYWATTTLTTVGYGDIFPTSNIGRIISMVSAIVGVAIIALPSGVITASYLDELKNDKKNE